MSRHKRAAEIAQATVFIEQRLELALSIDTIADEVGLSAFHFQRLFIASLGESVADYIRRRRLERGALLLHQQSHSSVIDIALAAGFESHSAFSRAFRSHFGLSPSAFRRGPGATTVTGNRRPLLLPARQHDLALAVDLITLPTLWLLYRQRAGMVNGSYFPSQEGIAAEFEALAAQAGDDYWGNCSAYDGGPSSFSDERAIGYYGGLFEYQPSLPWSEHSKKLPAGLWAVVPHFGSYQHLYMSWNKAVRNWLPGAGFSLRHDWAFETYLQHSSPSIDNRASAQIYLPIQKIE